MEIATNKIDSIINQISNLNSLEKEKIFDFFEEEQREYFFKSIIKEANDLEKDFKENKVKAENVNDFLNRILLENV